MVYSFYGFDDECNNVDLMNDTYIMLYVKALFPQHLLNKPLTNRESNKLMLFPSQLFFSIVENLLRVYAVYYQ